MFTKPDQAVVDRIASQCLAVRVRMLNRAITGLYDDALRPLAVKVSQINILVVVAKLGVAQPGRICDILHMDASTVSRNAERMIARGWLEVVPDDDARLQPLRITNEGMALIRRAAPGWGLARDRRRQIPRGCSSFGWRPPQSHPDR